MKFKRDYCKNFTLQQSLFFYELCQNTRDSSTRRVSVVRGSDWKFNNKA